MKKLLCFVFGHKSTSSMQWNICDRCMGEAGNSVIRGDYIGDERITKWRK